MTNETTAPERIWLDTSDDMSECWTANEFASSGRDTEYVRVDALETAQARIAELEADRDKWQVAFGHVLSAIPLPDVIRASGSVRDLIDYLKEELNG